MTRPSVITIATADGAGSEATGRLVAEQLGYRYINEEIIIAAARRAGVDPAEVAAVEQAPTLMARLLAALGTMSSFDGTGAPLPEAGPDQPAHYRALIREAVDAIAAEGKVVIVAHGAGFQLRGRPDVLRTWVTATPETRAARIAADRGCSAGSAHKVVARADSARAAYLRRFYDIAREQPHHYDIVVCTDRLTPVVAAGVIIAAETSGVVTA